MPNDSMRPGSATSAASKSTISNVQNIADDVVDQAKDTVGDLMDQGRHTVEQARDVATSSLSELETRIRRKPLQAALIAAGAGFVLAMMARR